MKANFAGGPNPVPVKAALSLMGLSTDMVRLPLLPLEEAHRARMRAILESTGAMELGAPGAAASTGAKRATSRPAIERATATAHA
jgi:hypothetical protein